VGGPAVKLLRGEVDNFEVIDRHALEPAPQESGFAGYYETKAPVYGYGRGMD